MNKNNLIKKRSGSALMWMLIAFTVLIILSSSAIFIVQQDILETRKQEERLKTYYIALSGIDLTHAALMNPDDTPMKIENMITKLKSNGNTPITESIIVESEGVVRGTANVSVKRVTKDDKDWVQITSIGKLAGKDTSVSTVMRINESNTNQIVREKFGD
ncbi:MAG: hypothetical protein RBT15_05515 [Gudongella sp.]|jgi:hypothetical protein|nr:hypothetical protein [Gudongella sp.]